MTKARYTLVNPEMVGEWVWSIHKVGCKGITADIKAHGGSKELIRVDLDDEDDVMDALDVDDLGYGFHDVRVHDCTGWKPAPAAPGPKAKKVATRQSKKTPAKTGVPTSKPKKNGQADDEARAKANAILEGLIDKIVAARGTDDVGEGDQWADERLDTCNDYVYDLAVEVRKLRESGEAWWRIAHTLMLPGAGASAVQGKTGAAYARRLWERAWGLTYSGEKAPRETKARKEERAATAPARPYFTADEMDQVIIDTISGKAVEWVARLGTPGGLVISAQDAVVHNDPKTIKVMNGPQGRYVEFYEAGDAKYHHIAKSGPRRAVYIDRITRVGL